MNPAAERFHGMLQKKVETISIAVFKKDGIAGIAAQHHMIDGAGIVDAGFACHDGTLPENSRKASLTPLLILQEQEKEILKAIDNLLLKEDLGVANLVTVPGVGAKAAAAVVSELGDIRQFETTKKLTGFIGAHPRFNDSGNKAGHASMSKAGNKRLRRILWLCTIVAIRHNPTIKQAYENKLKEGKRKMVAIGHCMNKLIRIIWGVLTYNEPYDPAGGKRLVKLAENAA